jgi:hypothetical protein
LIDLEKEPYMRNKNKKKIKETFIVRGGGRGA